MYKWSILKSHWNIGYYREQVRLSLPFHAAEKTKAKSSSWHLPARLSLILPSPQISQVGVYSLGYDNEEMILCFSPLIVNGNSWADSLEQLRCNMKLPLYSAIYESNIIPYRRVFWDILLPWIYKNIKILFSFTTYFKLARWPAHLHLAMSKRLRQFLFCWSDFSCWPMTEPNGFLNKDKSDRAE